MTNLEFKLIWEWEKTKDKWCRYSNEKVDELNKIVNKNQSQVGVKRVLLFSCFLSREKCVLRVISKKTALNFA